MVSTSPFARVGILQQAVFTFPITVNIDSGEYITDSETGAELPKPNTSILTFTGYIKLDSNGQYNLQKIAGYNPNEKKVIVYCIEPMFPFTEETKPLIGGSPGSFEIIDTDTRDKLNITSDKRLPLKSKGLFSLDHIEVSQFSPVNEILGQKLFGTITYGGYKF